MEETDKWRIENFSGQNIGMWKLQLKALLIQKGLLITLEGKTKKPTSMADEDWDKLDQKVAARIILSLSSNVLFNVSIKTK